MEKYNCVRSWRREQDGLGQDQLLWRLKFCFSGPTGNPGAMENHPREMFQAVLQCLYTKH